MRLKLITLVATASVAFGSAHGAGAVKRSWNAPGAVKAGADFHALGDLSDIIQDVWLEGDALYIGTPDGLGVTRNGGETWQSFHADDGLGSSDVVACAARGGDIWASCIEVVETGLNPGYYGKGLAHYDSSKGKWYIYGKDEGLPADGPQELVWDILIDDAGVVWVALWSGGIGKSENNGDTWQLIAPPDRNGLPCHHLYSLAKRGNLIWAAAETDDSVPEDIKSGVFKSEDNGAHWTFYGRDQGVDGFCVVVNIQSVGVPPVAWVGTAPPGPGYPSGNGVYKTADGGQSWTDYRDTDGLGSNTVYGFTSAGPWAWAGTFGGVSRTDDGGATWRTSSTAEGLPSPYVTAMAAASETDVWAGTAYGLGFSDDSGRTWRKVELTPRTKPLDLAEAFAFPVPFAPGPFSFVTFRYALAAGGTITLDVYDFAGRRVKRVVDHEYRDAGERVDELWDGAREDGATAANGVYYFTIELNGAAAARGKFVILR